MSNIGETPPAVTPTVHDVAAAKILGDIRTLMQTVRGFGFTSASHRRRINPSAAVSSDFLLSVALALDSSEALRKVSDVTPEQIRDIVSFCNAYGPVGEDMALTANGVTQSVREQRATVGTVALRVYRVARNFHTRAERDVLVPHIANMKRALGRGRKKGVKPEPETAVRKEGGASA